MTRMAMPAVLAGMVALCAVWGQGAVAQSAPKRVVSEDAPKRLVSEGAPKRVVSEDAPKRVVSMNLCTDQLAMLLAGEGQLVSVSHLASDPRMSAMVVQASDYEMNRGLAEQIYLMQPDLVLAGNFTARASVDMLKRLGVPVVTFDPAYALEDVRARIAQMGAVLGHETRAQTMIAEFDAQLVAYRSAAEVRPRAALYYANGYTLGDKTLAGQILAAAGLDNIAAEAGFEAGGNIPLEVLAMAQPDTVITSRTYPAASRSEEVMGHPVIEELRASRPQAGMTSSDWVCGTPFVLRAVEDMVRLRDGLQGAKP